MKLPAPSAPPREEEAPEPLETKVLPFAADPSAAPAPAFRDMLTPRVDPPDATPGTMTLLTENQRLREDLKAARAAIEETAHLVRALTELEQRLYHLGEKYVQAITRLQEYDPGRFPKEQKQAG